MVVEVTRTAGGLALQLTGEWRALAYRQFDAALAAVDLAGAGRVEIATEGLAALDLTGAWRLREFVRHARQAGAEVAFTGTPPDQLRLVEEVLSPLESSRAVPLAIPGGGPSGPGEENRTIGAQPSMALSETRFRGTRTPQETDTASDLAKGIGARPVDAEVATLTFIGRRAVTLWRDMVAALAFLGRLSATALRALSRPRGLRPISIARHVYDTGITAIPIVALIAFLISVIIAYMSAQQLRGFGAQIFVVDLVTIGVLRELGVLLTAIIVAGRSGSAFAAEIGSMKLNEEVDALQATGVDPFEALVLPRVLGLVISLPLLTVVADLVGLVGGAVLCASLLHMPLDQYVNRVSQAISATTFWVGIVKAPVFAVLIAMAGTHRGMQVRGSSRELGRLTTVAVVQAIFLVILADALFAVLFMEIGI
ncbi:MAG TPA: ABC transporter permease [Steroidobacteraceae bacterium]|nr:ABC transporter permease [Steroidobacteraceae bacterium]